MVDKATTAAAKASYDRCCHATDFLQTFYRNFLAACPEAVPRFAHTNFEQQTKLLRHAVGLLLIFPNQPIRSRRSCRGSPSVTAGAI